MSDRYARLDDEREFGGPEEVEGVPAEEDLDEADVEERLEDEPDEAANRRDVPDDERTADRTEDD